MKIELWVGSSLRKAWETKSESWNSRCISHAYARRKLQEACEGKEKEFRKTIRIWLKKGGRDVGQEFNGNEVTIINSGKEYGGRLKKTPRFPLAGLT